MSTDDQLRQGRRKRTPHRRAEKRAALEGAPAAAPTQAPGASGPAVEARAEAAPGPQPERAGHPAEGEERKRRRRPHRRAEKRDLRAAGIDPATVFDRAQERPARPPRPKPAPKPRVAPSVSAPRTRLFHVHPSQGRVLGVGPWHQVDAVRDGVTRVLVRLPDGSTASLGRADVLAHVAVGECEGCRLELDEALRARPLETSQRRTHDASSAATAKPRAPRRRREEAPVRIVRIDPEQVFTDLMELVCGEGWEAELALAALAQRHGVDPGVIAHLARPIIAREEAADLIALPG